MNEDKAQSIVLAAGLMTFFLGWFYSAQKGQELPSGKFLVGASVTFLVLEILADISPDLAAALGVAIATTAFFHYGTSITSYLNAANNTPAKPAAPKQTNPRTPAPTHVAPQP
jgi:hypothetical protein